MRKFTISPFFVILACALFFQTPARAALGGKIESIDSDIKTLGLSRGVSKNSDTIKYVDLSSDNASNKIKVRQFISKSGDIFALAWKGRIGSQLDQLLGSYAADYKKKEIENPPRSGKIAYRKINAGTVVVEYWDTLRFVQGRAYAPALMPKEFNTDQVGINEKKTK